MFAIALGLALAFGLGGRDVAARLLESAYAKGEDVKDDVKRDLDTGVSRAKAEVEEKKDELQDRNGADGRMVKYVQIMPLKD